MVTGKKAFEGETNRQVMSAILNENPEPMRKLKPATPPQLERVIMKCREKDREDRWQAMADVEAALRLIAEVGQGALPTLQSWRTNAIASAAAIALVAMAVAATWLLRPSSSQQPVSRVTISLPPGQHLASLDLPAIAISPDGKNIVYVAVQGNQSPDRKGGDTQSEHSRSIPFLRILPNKE